MSVNLSKSSRFPSPGRGVRMWPMAAKPWENQEVQRASAPAGATYMFHSESNLSPRRAQGSLSPLPGACCVWAFRFPMARAMGQIMPPLTWLKL
jgi:hypothetical protein